MNIPDYFQDSGLFYKDSISPSLYISKNTELMYKINQEGTELLGKATPTYLNTMKNLNHRLEYIEIVAKAGVFISIIQDDATKFEEINDLTPNEKDFINTFIPKIGYYTFHGIDFNLDIDNNLALSKIKYHEASKEFKNFIIHVQIAEERIKTYGEVSDDYEIDKL